jgi:single-stranded-DNA-specific exonuclease
VSTSAWRPGEKRFRLRPYSYAEAAEIAAALEVPLPVAAVLVRRGHRTVEAARAFLDADERHSPSEFDGIERAVGVIRDAIGSGTRITVHGDYDVDGVTATAILIRGLRDLGADCDWLIPGRAEDGYGLTMSTIERLTERGTGLLITVDCGITSVDEIAAAKAHGIDVIVTDHHQPGPDLPDCPIVHPVTSGYPCPDLCAAGVAHKLAEALLGAERAEQDLDLVALATVADMVPLLGENRTLVRRGLERIRRSPRTGLRALTGAANVAPERVSESDLSFRLAPRINAAGRLYRADAAVELFLSDDEERAREIAGELDRANLDRRETEREVLADANRLLAELEAESEPGAAIVLWGEGWHPGVVGICASRMAERHLRPAILIALDESGRGKGSGRSVPGFDLLAGLRACGGVLARFGGHKAAAGLEIDRDKLEEFRESFEAHCAPLLAGEPQARVEDVDAVVGAESLGHELASQMARLGPFGMGNPEVRLVVAGARIDDVRPMGEEARHARFTLRSGMGRTGGVAFGVGGTLERASAAGPLDASVCLELNEWNGAVEPRVVLGSLYEPPVPPPDDPWIAGDAEFFARLRAAFQGPIRTLASDLEHPEGAREIVDHTSVSALAAIGELFSTGERVLVLCADALSRRGLLESAVHPGRYAGGDGALLAARGSLEKDRCAIEAPAKVALADWETLSFMPDLPTAFAHVVLADPPPHRSLAGAAGCGEGHLHLLAARRELALGALSAALPGRHVLAEVFAALRAGGDALDAASLRKALAGPGGNRRSPETCALALRALTEIGVVRASFDGPEVRVEALSSVRGDLSSSMSFRLLEKANEECHSFLSQPDIPSSSPLEAAA